MVYKADVLYKSEVGFNLYTALRWFPFHPVAQTVAAETRYDLNVTLRQSSLFVRPFFKKKNHICHRFVTF